jgi:hypothetical protein
MQMMPSTFFYHSKFSMLAVSEVIQQCRGYGRLAHSIVAMIFLGRVKILIQRIRRRPADGRTTDESLPTDFPDLGFILLIS